MSVGRNLQEMENVVTKGAAPAEPMPSAGIPVEDLGGPTPQDYTNEPNGSAKLKDPSATLAQVRDVVNAKAVKAEAVKEEKEEIKKEITKKVKEIKKLKKK